MICIQTPDGTIFFPDDEITDAKAIESAKHPAIAFRSRGTGGLQFIKRYKTSQERDEALQAAQNARKPENEDMTEKLLERIRATEEELERMRKAQKKEKPAKKPAKSRAKKEKAFVPPTTEEIIAYIKEKKIDEKLQVPAEVIAESFRGVYEKEEDTGEKDENGFTIYKTVWRKANGQPIENWKSCLQTFKSRQLVWDAKKESRPAKKNQFTEFAQNSYTDEELEELENL